MRTFEIFILALILFIFIGQASSLLIKFKISKYTPLLMIPVFAIHMFSEGIRWQMYPLYLLSLSLVVGFTFRIRNRNIIRKPSQRFLVYLLATVLIITTAAASYILPVNNLPEPDGDFKVGTKSFEISDPSRNEVYTDTPDDLRKIRVQVWYPTESTEGLQKSPWLEGGEFVSKGMARLMGFPEIFMSHLSLVKSNSFWNAKLSNSEDKYPVVVISHGWTSFKNMHANFAELLASNGYIVVGIDHTYGSLSTVFSDGEVAWLNRNALPSGLKPDKFATYSTKLVETYSGDILLTLDYLEKMNGGQIDSMFKDRINLGTIGALGHSTGGGAGVRSAIIDNRIKAVFGLDPWVEPVKDEYISKGLHVPAEFLRSEQWETKPNNKNLMALLDNSSNASLYSVKGTLHNNFTMTYMVSPLSDKFKQTGPINKEISLKIQMDFIKTFFNRNLKDDLTVYSPDGKYVEVTKVYGK